MSFIITVYVSEAIVMASDSRQLITIKRQAASETNPTAIETINSDFVYKTFLLANQRTAVSTCGESMLGKVNVASYVKRFEEEKLREKDDVVTVAQKITEFFAENFPGAHVSFHVAGFRKESGISMPYVYGCYIARNEVKRLNVKPSTEEITYGAAWGGEGDIMARVFSSYGVQAKNETAEQRLKAMVVWDAMPVQDAIDFAIYAVRTTIDTIRFQARPKTVGGPIDVLLLTPEIITWIQKKQYTRQPGEDRH